LHRNVVLFPRHARRNQAAVICKPGFSPRPGNSLASAIPVGMEAMIGADDRSYVVFYWYQFSETTC
jgi:hypothetical protein